MVQLLLLLFGCSGEILLTLNASTASTASTLPVVTAARVPATTYSCSPRLLCRNVASYLVSCPLARADYHIDTQVHTDTVVL